MFVFVSDEPEIEVEAEKVHSGVGKEAHLSCIVHGEPKPSVSLPIFFLFCFKVGPNRSFF